MSLRVAGSAAQRSIFAKLLRTICPGAAIVGDFVTVTPKATGPACACLRKISGHKWRVTVHCVYTSMSSQI